MEVHEVLKMHTPKLMHYSYTVNLVILNMCILDTCVAWDQPKGTHYQELLIFQIILCTKEPFGTFTM